MELETVGEHQMFALGVLRLLIALLSRVAVVVAEAQAALLIGKVEMEELAVALQEETVLIVQTVAEDSAEHQVLVEQKELDVEAI